MQILSNTVSAPSAAVTELQVENSVINSIIWVSDLHGDSPHSNLKFLEATLNKYPDSLLIIGGDHLDVMQNFGDRRASKSDLKKEFKREDYLNEIIDHNVRLWGKYAHRIIAFFVGNHEATQNRYHGIDLTRQIVKELNLRFSTNIICGDAAGWLKLRFILNKQKRTKNIYFAHRPISGGTRSKGMLSVDLIKGRYPDADIYIAEHIHDTWIKPERVEVLTPGGKVKYKVKWVLQMPTLKDEFKGKKRGYAHDKSFGATPVGLILLQFTLNHDKQIAFSPKYELMPE